MNNHDIENKIDKYLDNYDAMRIEACNKALSHEHRTRKRNMLLKCVNFFTERNIISPSKTDYEMLENYIRENDGKTPRGEKTVNDWLGAVKRFYNFCEGESQMSFINSDESKCEDLSLESNLESKHDFKFSDSGQVVNRGRKPKRPEDKKSAKLNIYLTPSLCEDLKELAYYSEREISEILFSLASDFVERNRAKLEAYREFKRQAGMIN